MTALLYQDKPFTYEDYSALPDDGRRWELLEGDLFLTPAPWIPHQSFSARLLRALMEQLGDSGRAIVLPAPVDVLLGEHDCPQPDLVVVRSERRSIVTKRAVEGPPDLVVEILSAYSHERDLHTKRRLYARFGIPEYWVVDTDARRIGVLRLRRGRYVRAGDFGAGDTLCSPGFPEIEIPAEPLFHGP